jgi:plastocyanin
MDLERRTVMRLALAWAAVAAATTVVVTPGHGAADAVTTIGQKDRAFSRAEVTLTAGERLRFANDDAVVHNVFSATPGFEFNLRTQKPGQASEISFDKAGTVEVRCAIHPTMKLRVTVRDRERKE